MTCKLLKQVALLWLLQLVFFNAYSQKWELVESNTTQSLNSVYFPSDKIGYVVGDYGTLLKTTDGGSSWSSSEIPGYPWSKSLFFTGNETGIVVGYGGKIAKASPTTSSVVQLQDNKAISFPNPTTGIVNIETDFEIKSISVIDITGKEQKFRNVKYLSENKVCIDLTDFSKGIYFAVVKGENIHRMEKVVVQ